MQRLTAVVAFALTFGLFVITGCDGLTGTSSVDAPAENAVDELAGNAVNANSSATTEIVNETDVGEDWTDAATQTGGEVSFVQDWGAPSGLGIASLELSTINDNQSKASLLTDQFSGTPLSEITELSYWTYQASGPDLAAPTYQLQISLDGGDSFCGTMVFEPYWQNDGKGDPAPVVSGEWQEWTNAEDGEWWSTCDALGTGLAGPPFTSITEVANNHSDAVVLAVGTSIGTFNPDWTVAADGLTFGTTGGTTTFNFDVVPGEKDDCKKGGWQNLANGDGEEFVNQGDCVSYVASGGRTQGPKK